jgi:hypothetical protein
LLKRVDYFPVILVRLRGLELELLVEYPYLFGKGYSWSCLAFAYAEEIPQGNSFIVEGDVELGGGFEVCG